MSGYIQDMLDIEVEPSSAGYNVGKWSDDDDWHPITPFLGKIR